MKGLLVIAVGLTFAACSSNTDKTSKESTETAPADLSGAIREVKQFEDSLKKASGTLAFNAETAVVYAEKCLAVSHRFPKSKEAPRFMDKAHIIFASAGLHQRSVIIADSLIMLYPLYKNRPMVLESLAGAYDVFVVPRQKEKVKFYYELLLKENPDMDAEQRRQIEDRLKYVDLTFDEYVSKSN